MTNGYHHDEKKPSSAAQSKAKADAKAKAADSTRATKAKPGTVKK